MVKFCPLQSGKRGETCPDCGFQLLHDVPVIPKVVCGSFAPGAIRAAVFDDQERGRLLGDWMKDFFEKSGATHLYELARKELGLPDDCGGCEQRRKWINNAHAWIKSKLGH